MKRIITHPGTFHADECVAIATAMYFEGIKSWDSILMHVIERRNPTQEDLDDPETWIIDHGKHLNIVLNNYDHHQDTLLAASNIQVLDACYVRNIISSDMYDILRETLYNHVSMVDTTGEKADHAGVPTLSRIIRGLNGLENGFEMAMQVAFAAVLSAINAAELKLKAKELWGKVEKFDGYAVNDSSNFISGWQELAKEEGIMVLITPNREAGKYQILSRDSSEITIPSHPDQTHNGGWMAVYPSLESAIAHAQEICK